MLIFFKQALGLSPSLLHRMLYPVALLRPLAVVEAVQGSHQIAGDAADALKGHAVGLGAAAAGALVADDAGSDLRYPTGPDR